MVANAHKINKQKTPPELNSTYFRELHTPQKVNVAFKGIEWENHPEIHSRQNKRGFLQFP